MSVISNPWANPLIGGPNKLSSSSSGGIFGTLDNILESWVKVEQVKAVNAMTKAEARQASERGTVDYQDGIKAGQTGQAPAVPVSSNTLLVGVFGLLGVGLIAWMLR